MKNLQNFYWGYNMISISMITADVDGDFIINNTSRCNFGVVPARVVRSLTLDGGTVIHHYGTSHGDRIFNVDIDTTKEQADKLKYIHESASQVIISIKEGVFLGALSSVTFSEGKITATIFIKDKEND